jgi:hypothetical protein
MLDSLHRLSGLGGSRQDECSRVVKIVQLKSKRPPYSRGARGPSAEAFTGLVFSGYLRTLDQAYQGFHRSRTNTRRSR